MSSEKHCRQEGEHASTRNRVQAPEPMLKKAGAIACAWDPGRAGRPRMPRGHWPVSLAIGEVPGHSERSCLRKQGGRLPKDDIGD